MKHDLQAATTRIVTAYLGRNEASLEDLPALISQVFETLHRLTAPVREPALTQTPAVPIKKSVTPDHLVCLECGYKAKMLKRHLQVRHAMSPAEYRNKWGLPRDYPAVAPGYAKLRAELAHAAGLGRQPRAKLVPLNRRRKA